MTGAAAPWSAGLKAFINSPLLHLAMALLLAAGWAALELHTGRLQTAAKMADAARTTRTEVQDLVYRVSAAAARVPVADAPTENRRVALTATMLRLETGLEPARSLFFYDARGRFVAATLPLLPSESDVSRTAWFRAVARDPQPGETTLIVGVHAPLGDDEGVIIARTVADRTGAFAGVVGTFVAWPAFRTLLSPPSLPSGTEVVVVYGAARALVLSFSVGAKHTPTWLDTLLSWTGGARRVSATTDLPGGFLWRATVGAPVELSNGEQPITRWGAPVLVTGLLALAALRCRTASKPRKDTKETHDSAARNEPDWLWELDAEGRLVGVAGNAPQRLIAAIGANFLDLVTDDQRSRDLRDAIARRTPIQNLDLVLALPGALDGSRYRVLLNGRPVDSTGGFWGTGAEFCASSTAEREAGNSKPSRAADRAQVPATSASSLSTRPSSVFPNFRASVLRWRASI